MAPACSSIAHASSGLVWKLTVSATAVSVRRSGTSAQPCGRYRRRSRKACPCGPTWVRNTPTWQFSSPPTRCTAAARPPTWCPSSQSRSRPPRRCRRRPRTARPRIGSTRPGRHPHHSAPPAAAAGCPGDRPPRPPRLLASRSCARLARAGRADSGRSLPHFPSIEEGRKPRMERREGFVPGIQVTPMLPYRLLSAASLLHGRAASLAHRRTVK
jgi:hypothetical protein